MKLLLFTLLLPNVLGRLHGDFESDVMQTRNLARCRNADAPNLWPLQEGSKLSEDGKLTLW